MPPPAVNPITARIYEEIKPVTYGDADNGYALLHFIEGWTRHMKVIEEVVRDTDAGPGWSPILNPDTAPALFLDFLATLAGTRLPVGASEATKRTSIRAMEGLKRGSPDAIASAIRRHLTGTRYVLMLERAQANAWRLSIRTLDAETADPNVVRAAILEQKPAGIVLDYEEQTDRTDYADIAALYLTYATVYEDPDYQAYEHLYTTTPTPGI